MECLSPSQQFLFDLIRNIEIGHSCNMALKNAIQTSREPIRSELSEILFHYEASKSFRINEKLPDLRKVIYETVACGLKGLPILDKLKSLSAEADVLAQKDIDDYIAKTPLFSLFVVLFFYFPAFLILIIGPAIKNMLAALGS